MNRKYFKLSLFVFLLISTLISHGQFKITENQEKNSYLISKLDSMGIDKGQTLNRSEVDYFNAKYEGKCGMFDFNGKKIVFFRGSSGGVRTDKENYFVVERRRYQQDLYSNFCDLILFDEKQKKNREDTMLFLFTGLRFVALLIIM